MIGFSAFGIIIFYFAILYRPLRLLDKVLSNIVSDLSDSFYVFDPNGSCIWANEQGCRLAGISGSKYAEISARLTEMFGSADSPEEESFSDGLLEYPQYTRPRNLNGLEVPEILLNGDHAKIRAWRRRESLKATLMYRPDLLETASLGEKDLKTLEEIRKEMNDNGSCVN